MRFLTGILIFLFIGQAAIALPDIEKTKTLIKKAEAFDQDSELSQIQFAIGQIESSFGDPTQLIGDNNHSFGIFQIQVPTAKDVAQRHHIPLPASNSEIRALLLENEALAVLLNRLLLKDLITKYNSLKLGVLAYNQGEYAIDTQLKTNKTINETYYNRFKFYYKNEYISNTTSKKKNQYYIDDQGFVIGTDNKTILVLE